MAKYKVSISGKDGDIYEETIEAADRFQVYRDIRERGDRVVEIVEDGKQGFSLQALEDMIETVPMDEKVIFARNIAAMLDAGLTTSRALSVMERQTKSRRFKKIIASLIAEVKRGGTFSSAMGKYPGVFSSLMISMARAGEESGKLSEALRVVGTQMERASNLTKKVRGALMYPSIVLFAMVIIGILMLMFVVPTLTQTFKELNTQLPPTTQFIIGVSNFLTTHIVVSLVLIAAFVIGVLMAARTKEGKSVLDWVFLHIPVISGLVMETNAARTARTLSSLLSAGVDVILSISITRDVLDNHYYKKVLVEAEASVSKGGQMSASFEKYPNLYPPLIAEMVAVGEETGRLSDLLKDAAVFYEDSVERETKDLSTIIEPFLMLIIGAAVGFFALSMIAPIYSLSNAI